jgi:hypothetical protein
MECPKLSDCPLLGPHALDAARTYLASRYCQGDYFECMRRRQRLHAALERPGERLEGHGAGSRRYVVGG